jgi:hypothetical protein
VGGVYPTGGIGQCTLKRKATVGTLITMFPGGSQTLEEYEEECDMEEEDMDKVLAAEKRSLRGVIPMDVVL